ncbi:MAG: hypothetical protein DRJ49_00670 [Thermoprotei archaeon]|nr:MAG: hypothetical protein DRN53_03690 [Thermoprotei archaeon]RLE90139.1 MAG: hypothetical protein DRJ49_00670 [Thermoprotei archaeon]RLG36027.1 MAG: hypothetical protein DRN91_08830 [Candidatus Alkanophagales archaeon]
MSEWVRRKRHFLMRLLEDAVRSKVDRDILDLLMLINSIDELYTTSSCSGRIQLVAVEEPGDKLNLKVIAKWHSSVEYHEVENVLRGHHDNLWMVVQAPILHIVARDLTTASKVLSIARMAGFKNSGLISLHPERYVVQVASTESMSIPLILKGKCLLSPEEIKVVLTLCSKLLNRSKDKLLRLTRLIREEFYSNS